MSKHLEREIDRVKQLILSLGTEVENSVRLAVKSLLTRNIELAQQVVDTDAAIDQHEVDIEEECLKILALHQPVAVDLRFLISVLKMNNDLERIGDLAANIAERAVSLGRQTPVPPPYDLATMVEKVQEMLRLSLDALVDTNLDAARKVLLMDDEVDEMHRMMYDKVKTAITHDLDHTDALIQFLAVSRNLERMADHATNIAEDVIYLVEGQIARHKPETWSGEAFGK